MVLTTVKTHSDPRYRVVLTDSSGNKVSRIDLASGEKTTIGGTGYPQGLATSGYTIYYSDSNNYIRSVSMYGSGSSTIVARGLNSPRGVARQGSMLHDDPRWYGIPRMAADDDGDE